MPRLGGKDWAIVKYSIATCPHCPPSEAQRKIDGKCATNSAFNNSEFNGSIRIFGSGTQQYKFECRKDSSGRDERVILPCSLHAAREWTIAKRHGQVKRKEELDQLLEKERLRDEIPARLQTQQWHPGPRLASKANIVEQLEDGTTVDDYPRRTRDKLMPTRVDWVNHPTGNLLKGHKKERAEMAEQVRGELAACIKKDDGNRREAEEGSIKKKGELDDLPPAFDEPPPYEL